MFPSWIVFSLPHLVLLVKTFFYFFFGVLGKLFSLACDCMIT
nr:MAG TPA: hypothetical protein [Caudoviricetes sp.]